jgi:hypothetical protein
MDTLPGTQFTDDWMQDPWGMTDPSQLKNPYSNYAGSAMPWPPTYAEGNMGGPVNAATGQPIQSYQQWKAANPGGMTLNATPAQPAAPQADQLADLRAQMNQGIINSANAMQSNNTGTFGNVNTGIANYPGAVDAIQSLANYRSAANQAYAAGQNIGMPGAGTPSPQAQPQQSGPPNNWQAALQALANPGNPTTQGATVPMVQGYQPAGGVNQAFLQQAQGRPGMNQNFLSALSAIQGRPQQQWG